MNRIGLVGYDWAVAALPALNPKESAPSVSARSRLVIMVQLQLAFATRIPGMAVTVVTQTSILILFLMSALGQKRKCSQ
jgi:hypothetical protein